MKYLAKTGLLCITIILLVCFSGCVTPGAIQADSKSEIPRIQKKYSERLDNTKLGMLIIDFIKIWPDAYKTGETSQYIIYEFKDSQLYYTSHDKEIGILWTGTIKTQEYIQKFLFYFTEDKLIKYETISN